MCITLIRKSNPIDIDVLGLQGKHNTISTETFSVHSIIFTDAYAPPQLAKFIARVYYDDNCIVYT